MTLWARLREGVATVAIIVAIAVEFAVLSVGVAVSRALRRW